jgi:hypothetical protein
MKIKRVILKEAETLNGWTVTGEFKVIGDTRIYDINYIIIQDIEDDEKFYLITLKEFNYTRK